MLWLSLLIPLGTGLILTSFLCRDQLPIRTLLLIKISLAVGLGLGISSISFFIGSLAPHLSNDALIILEIILSLILSGVLLYRMKGHYDLADSLVHYPSTSNLTMQWALLGGFSIACAAAIASTVLLSWNFPHGSWDAWAIWNMRARFLFRGGDQWRNAFSNDLAWSHPDYPLLIPGLIARGWKYVGYETLMLPALVSMLFTFATVGLLCSSLSILRSKSQSLLAGLVLLATPLFVVNGASQMADIPLGFFFLATLVLFCLHDRLSSPPHGLISLAGLTTGFTLWTKNEGSLFLVSIILAHLASIVAVKGWKVYLREIRPFAMGLLPIAITVLYFKIQMAPPNELLSQGFEANLQRFGDLSRYWMILKAFTLEMVYWGDGLPSLPLLLAGYFFLLGPKFAKTERLGIAISVTALTLVLIGYFLAYVISPYDLPWHLLTSVNRLLLQLWPSTLFIFFLLTKNPEEALRVK